MVGLTIGGVVIGLEGHGIDCVRAVLGTITVMHHAPTMTSGVWMLSIHHLCQLCWLHWPTHLLFFTDSLTVRLQAHKVHTQKYTCSHIVYTLHNMHEIAHAAYFKAWMNPIVVYYRACETENRITGVACGDRALRHRHNAVPSSVERQTVRERWKGGFSSLLFQSLPFLCI